MKLIFATAAAALAAAACMTTDAVPVKSMADEGASTTTTTTTTIPVQEEDVRTQFQHEQLFLSFKEMFGKKYESVAEEEERFGNFKASLARIAQQNKEHMAKHGTAVFGVNKFSDWSVAEFKGKMLNRKPASPEERIAGMVNMPTAVASNVTSVDWRSKGAVTQVKNQGQCGSCWAFGATEAIESAWYIKNHHLLDLAPQQLVSCDTVDQGCNGGDLVSGFKYVEQAGGLMLEADYPYTSGNSGSNGQCMFNSTAVAASITGWQYAVPGCFDACNHQSLDTAIAAVASVGPPAICAYAESWMDYSSGVFHGECKHGYNDLDHCIQAVGFDVGASDPYWNIRNSWGSDWGEEGYIRITTDNNHCGILTEMLLPTV